MKVLVLLIVLFQIAQAAVLSQWRGPQRDGHYPETHLLKVWPENGPTPVWQTNELGKGFTSAAVTDRRVYTTGMFDGVGYLFAFDLQGNLLWKKAYGQEWTTNYEGTRSTPVVVDDRLYLLSGQGVLYCLSDRGERVWSVDLYKRFGGLPLEWGIAEQLLVDGDRIFCTPGGKVSVAALNRFDGKTIWTSAGNGESSSYCSPILINHNGIPMLITLMQKSVIGIRAENGELLWRHRHEAPYDIHANAPIYYDGGLFFQSGEGGSGALLKIADDGKSVTVVWEHNELDALTGHTVLIDGYIYGAGFNTNGFLAIEWNTGLSKINDRTVRRAAVIAADGMIYAYSEKGVVSLIKPNPQRFEQVSSFKVTHGSGPHWAHPVIKDGRLYVRHGEALMVYDIREK